MTASMRSHGKEVKRRMEEFEPVDIRDIPDDELDDLFGGTIVTPYFKVA